LIKTTQDAIKSLLKNSSPVETKQLTRESTTGHNEKIAQSAWPTVRTGRLVHFLQSGTWKTKRQPTSRAIEAVSQDQQPAPQVVIGNPIIKQANEPKRTRETTNSCDLKDEQYTPSNLPERRYH
jgi:hypothetical protein